MTDTPEIKALEERGITLMQRGTFKWVPVEVAIQAVRDTEARVRADCAATYLLDGVAEARREAFREAVEALIPDEVHVLVQSAIDPNAHVTTQAVEVLRTLRGMLTARFLSPDNPEGNA